MPIVFRAIDASSGWPLSPYFQLSSSLPLYLSNTVSCNACTLQYSYSTLAYCYVVYPYSSERATKMPLPNTGLKSRHIHHFSRGVTSPSNIPEGRSIRAYSRDLLVWFVHCLLSSILTSIPTLVRNLRNYIQQIP